LCKVFGELNTSKNIRHKEVKQQTREKFVTYCSCDNTNYVETKHVILSEMRQKHTVETLMGDGGRGGTDKKIK